MLPNTITLAVDEANNATLINAVFSRDEEYLNRTVYAAANSSIIMRDTLGFYRTKPTKNGNFLGVAKSTIKFTVDQIVDGADGVAHFTQPVLAEVSFSIPVGTPAAAVKEIRQRIVALLDRDDIMTEAQERLQI